MARAPPSDDSEPELIEFGIPVLDDRLDEADLDFPADKRDVLSALHDTKIPIDASGHTVALSEALQRVDQEAFDSERDLLDALHPVFEGYRQRTASGIVGTLRSMLPF